MRVVQHKKQVCWYADQIFSQPHPQLFDPHWWQSQKAVVGSAIGRGVTWFVKLDGRHMVLRHYYRGGMVGKVVDDRFWFEKVEGSRAMAEFALLERLCELDLPVPKPYAARMSKSGFFYRADIILERIRGARDLVDLLKKGAIPEATWRRIGQVLRRFHDAGVYHADLNSHNILIDRDDKVWLIDFDKGAIKTPGAWQQANLERLLRSFNKESELHTSFHWVPENWQCLMQGYKG